MSKLLSFITNLICSFLSGFFRSSIFGACGIIAFWFLALLSYYFGCKHPVLVHLYDEAINVGKFVWLEVGFGGVFVAWILAFVMTNNKLRTMYYKSSFTVKTATISFVMFSAGALYNLVLG